MPISPDVDATDNLVVKFDEPNQKQTFKIILTNKGKELVKVRQIRCYNQTVAVVSFNKEHADIEPNGEIEYLFEAELPTNASAKGKIRFGFHNRSHVTRTYTLIGTEPEPETETVTQKVSKKSRRKKVKKEPKQDVQQVVKKVDKIDVKKEVNVDVIKEIKAEKDHKNEFERLTQSKIKSIIEKVKPMIAKELLHEDWPEDEAWIKQFREDHPVAVDITDNLYIKFERDQSDKSFAVFIRNNLWKTICLDSIEIDLPSITVRYNDFPMIIEPRGDISVIFDAVFVPNKFGGVGRLSFNFKNAPKVRRSVGISYREKGRAIQPELYDPPAELIDLIYNEKLYAKSKVLGALDEWIPSINESYGTHFHNLLFLEEIGKSKEFKELYNKKEVFFGDTNCFMEDGNRITKKYPHGIYDLMVNDLFETRPSLQMGDKVIVRKHSAPNVVYEGFIIEKKVVDRIVVKFGDNFVETFEHSAYYAEFDFSRSYMVRQHYAIDLALELFGLGIIMPTEISLRGIPTLDLRMTSKGNMIQRKTGKCYNFFNNNLNEQQKEAVIHILRCDLQNPYLIFGPPGTGKTTTLVEIILQMLCSIGGSRILITTQSNSASNLITQLLVESKQLNTNSLLRLISFNYASQPDEVPEDIKTYSKTYDDLIEDKTKAKEMNFFERLEMVKNYRVVIGTFSTIAKLLEGPSLRNHFTHSIIDEAGQCTETDVLVPLVLVGGRGQTIMAGDPMQMPPIVINSHANYRGLAVPMLSRLIECYTKMDNNNAGHKKHFAPQLISKLVQNYRSLPSILEFTNKQFYNSELIPMIDAVTSREAKLLKHLDEMFPNIENPGAYGIHFFNVDARNEKRKTSFFNVDEVRLTRVLVDKLKKRGLPEEDIGIITPYALQLDALQNCHAKNTGITIGTVEDFQGLERKVILISTVRTCKKEAIVDVNRRLGFVKCPKRINVAMSRARTMVIVIGNANLLKQDENWLALIRGCEENGTYNESNAWITNT